MSIAYRWIFGSVLACASPVAAAAENEPDGAEIVVTARPSQQRVMPGQLVLDDEVIAEIQPLVVADIMRGMAGVSLRQNSRGETIVRIRSGGERQTPIFLDGAPLATPWDGRIDLGILPSGIIRQVAITRSAAPIEYGANAISGVIDLRTSTAPDKRLIRGEVQTGSGNLLDLSVLALAPFGTDGSLTLAATHRDSNYTAIADRKAVPFDPSTRNRRTNSDQRTTSLFAAIGHDAGSARLRFSVLHADAARGIPAQGHIDPAITSPRYWRYPLWRLTQATLNASADLGGSISLRSVFWHQWFAQDVDSYTDSSYLNLEEREGGHDRTFGGRLTFSGPLGAAQWRISTSALSSTHRQIISGTATGISDDLAGTQRQRFRHQFLSVGAEVDVPLTSNVYATFGAGIDASFTPLTGDKPGQSGSSAPSLSAILRWKPSADFTVKASLAQRTRFATMREQFGQALGRFLPNPGLKPERANTAEMTLSWHASEMFQGDIAIWANDSHNTLGQRVIAVDGRNLRQRYNMRGALTYGLEVSANIRLSDQLTAEFSAAFQGGKPRSEVGDSNPGLVQQTNRQIAAALDWTPVPMLDLRAEYRHHGRAFDLDESGAFIRLPTADLVNLRAFWSIRQWRDGGSLRASLSLENATNALLLPQLGLPAPGRTVRLGLRVEFGS